MRGGVVGGGGVEREGAWRRRRRVGWSPRKTQKLLTFLLIQWPAGLS